MPQRHAGAILGSPAKTQMKTHREDRANKMLARSTENFRGPQQIYKRIKMCHKFKWYTLACMVGCMLGHPFEELPIASQRKVV